MGLEVICLKVAVKTTKTGFLFCFAFIRTRAVVPQMGGSWMIPQSP